MVGDECCDDGNLLGNDGCPSNCTLTQRQVFVTSVTHNGDFNGLAGADMFCQNLAEIAGLTGTFRAWLSTNTTSPVGDWEPTAACDLPYVRLDGVPVALTWGDLLDGSLLNDISIDESGQNAELSGITYNVWTGTEADGTAAVDRCSNWTSTSGLGEYGGLNQSDYEWIAYSEVWCSNINRLYCFEHQSP